MGAIKDGLKRLSDSSLAEIVSDCAKAKSAKRISDDTIRLSYYSNSRKQIITSDITVDDDDHFTYTTGSGPYALANTPENFIDCLVRYISKYVIGE